MKKVQTAFRLREEDLVKLDELGENRTATIEGLIREAHRAKESGGSREQVRLEEVSVSVSDSLVRVSERTGEEVSEREERLRQERVPLRAEEKRREGDGRGMERVENVMKGAKVYTGLGTLRPTEAVEVECIHPARERIANGKCQACGGWWKERGDKRRL